ncbi:MAG: TSUP family transporter [Phycisphaera sp.]|nr:TSUP family transporter [Phycisphaera sp.]
MGRPDLTTRNVGPTFAEMYDPTTLLMIALLGLVAGTLGGMLGVGGSLIMIPGLVFMFGQGDQHAGFNQHLYQAAAMIVNVFVAVPATLRHYKAGAVVKPVIKAMLPGAIVGILIGVYASNLSVFTEGVGGVRGPVVLGRVMAVFMLYVIAVNVRKMFVKPKPHDDPVDLTHVTPSRSGAVGSAMGFIAGLLGVGGGAIAVPMQQVLLKLRLRNCIANSAAVMCLSSVVGAAYKNASLGAHGLAVSDSLTIAALLAPTAMIGGYLGAKLTHVLPVRVVRGVFIFVIVAAAWKMAGL